jgi:formylglycine-generating enzyme required for sulfatase activity
VTNRQFAGFVAAGGYGQRRWWSDAGWRVKECKGWTKPRYWDSRDWGRPDCPVVGVSWYEAQAFCRWWSQQTGRSINLPTEKQWQRAAQGDDGREYPWGDRPPEARLCNWNRNVDETTPVMQYPAGASPFGVLDMSGNVWEWCRTGWGRGTPVTEGDETRLLRGGCWSSDSPLSLRAANRNPKDPNNRLDPGSRNLVTVGFRVVGCGLVR